MFNLDPDNYKIFLSTQLEMLGIMFGVSSCISLNTIPNPFIRVHLELVIHSPGEFNLSSIKLLKTPERVFYCRLFFFNSINL